ncbi:MAG: hypothetical protein JW744_03020 [Candidatus Diapherotrites archaeon]|uniref:Transcription factor E n=1 Tax=Candidatus Iainarchaeum sp. TaxID=3101447 RepID=A0A939C8W6_9ARCH|nr:hypothetical protein [Candidatus Diapherotrites archaeon]
MNKKIIASGFPLAQNFLKKVAGDPSVQLVRICERKGKRTTDEELAKKMKMKVTEVRTILNRLHYRGIAHYQKTKNKKTGWYNYTWEIKSKRILELLLEEQKEAIEKLKTTQSFEKTYTYFTCKRNCTSVPFEVAAEFQFKCPECNSTMEATNSDQRVKKIEKQITGIEREIETMAKII